MSVESYRVRISKDHLVFCSSHFITFDGNQCEPLHGHNFRAEIEVQGPLDENQYVVDFIALMKHAKAIRNEFDHRVLLPAKSRHIVVEEHGAALCARCKERVWSFPKSDCLVLPIENVTTELLARHIGLQLLEALQREHHFTPEVLRVELEEGVGNSAIWEWRN